MARNYAAKGVSDEMTIYNKLDSVVSAHMASAGIPYKHEAYDVPSGVPPDKFAVFSVISDVPDSFYSDNNRRIDYRVQLDMVFPAGDRAGLHAAYLALEAVLKSGGARPQGNYRMQTADDGREYIQKDYKFTIWESE